MLRHKSSTLCLKNFSRLSSFVYTRRICSQPVLAEQSKVARITNLQDSLVERLKAVQQQRPLLSSQHASIYRVPANLRGTEKGAYDPHVVSIGPYHHGLANLQVFEGLKLESLNRVFGSSARASDELNRLLTVLEGVEPKARECYSEDVILSRDAFVEMMLLDGCFIVELFRDLEKQKFASSTFLPKRWMLPVVRRDLIILENQLPMIVLKKIFEETKKSNNPQPNSSLESLALNFFNPLMPKEGALLRQSIASITICSQDYHHLLDVFHSSITLSENMKRGKEPHMYRPLSELKKAGIKVRVLENKQPLEMRFENGVLRIPGLRIDNHTSCFLKNIVAYEQCHTKCQPDFTTYLFFLDKLVNSGEDVGVLHYEGVLQHSLGSNKQVSLI